MSGDNSMAADLNGPDASDIDSVRDDIEQARAELAATVEQVVDKLDVKKQAAQSVDDVKHAAAEKLHEAKATAPEPVQHTLDAVGQKADPAAAQLNTTLAPYRKQILLGTLAAAAAILIVRRVRQAND